MKKVVFLIGMMVVSFTGISQDGIFDNIPFLKEVKSAEPMVMFREYGNDTTVTIYGTVSEINDYSIGFIEWAGYKDENLLEHEIKKDKEVKTYVIEYEDGSALVTVIIIRKNDDYAELSSCIINEK
jgi:hypothetical protein